MRARAGSRWIAAVVVCAVTSCASRPEAGAPASTGRDTKPPVDAAALDQIYREPLAQIGLLLTPRGGLIDRSNGGYRRSADGTHLAIYLEPAAQRSTDEYVDGIASATRVFLPDVFERWPGLRSFDVCQEPLPSAREPKDPPPVTQIEVTRAQARAIDWSNVTVRDIVRAATDDPRRLKLVVSDSVRASDAYANAIASGP